MLARLRTGDSAWDFMKELHQQCRFMSRERPGRASNSELKRWLQNGAVVANGEKLNWDEPMDFPVHSFILFPKNRVTLY